LIVNGTLIAPDFSVLYIYWHQKVPVNPRIEDIPISEFDLSLSGMRIMNITRILQVEKSMRLHGQLQPVVARVHEEGFTLIDGFKRVYAAEDLMMETLECHLLEIDLSQAKVLLLSYNKHNQSMEAWEEAMVLKDLLETHDMDQQSLARLTGYSRSWVSRRLSLIGKIDEQVCSEIKMGTLTSSHARALTKLPRGNQADIARVIVDFHLTSRLSDRLVDAFLEAEDEQQQRHILAHPEDILWNQTDLPEDPYDARLSPYGNELMQSSVNASVWLDVLLSRLDDNRIDMFNETEKVIIIPFLKKVADYAEKLSEAISQLPTHKPTEQDER